MKNIDDDLACLKSMFAMADKDKDGDWSYGFREYCHYLMISIRCYIFNKKHPLDN